METKKRKLSKLSPALPKQAPPPPTPRKCRRNLSAVQPLPATAAIQPLSAALVRDAEEAKVAVTEDTTADTEEVTVAPRALSQFGNGTTQTKE